MKIEQRESIGPKTLYQTVRQAEDALFPGKFSDKLDIYTTETNSLRYFYHAPSHHVREGLLTPQLLGDLRFNNKTMLSVGSGAAHLEQLLVAGFAVPQDNIVLSDIYPHDLPSGFNTVIFDMTEPKWPDLGQQFDYVIFPESLLAVQVKFGHNWNPEKLAVYNGVLENALSVLKTGGEVRSDGYFHYVHEPVHAFLSSKNVDFKISQKTLEIKKR